MQVANHCEFGDKLCKSGPFLRTHTTLIQVLQNQPLVLSSLPLFAAAREHSIIIVGCKTRRNDLHFYSSSAREPLFPSLEFLLDAAPSDSTLSHDSNSIENAPNWECYVAINLTKVQPWVAADSGNKPGRFICTRSLQVCGGHANLLFWALIVKCEAAERM